MVVFFLLWIRPFKLPTLQSNSVSRPFIGTTEYFQIKDIQYCQLIMCPVCVLLNISTAAFLLSPVALAHVICKCFYSAFISIKSTPQIKPQLSVPLCCNQRSPIWLWWARKSKPPKRGESRVLKRMIRWLYWPGEWGGRPSGALLLAWFIHNPQSVIFIRLPQSLQPACYTV